MIPISYFVAAALAVVPAPPKTHLAAPPAAKKATQPAPKKTTQPAPAATPEAPARPVPPGKEDTGRQTAIEATLAGKPEDIYKLWTTVEGVKCFLAGDAKIEMKPGGPYELVFNPAKDPEGAEEGTKGARVLNFVPGKELTVEWVMPAFARELNTAPLATWVDITLAPDAPGLTRMRLTHKGFGRGPEWDRAYAFYRGSANMWRKTVERLAICATGGKPPAM